MATVHLIQPRHPDGARPYLPNGSLNLGARIRNTMHATHEGVRFTDLNVTHRLPDEIVYTDIVGISVLGTPYVPEVRQLVRRLRDHDCTQRVVIGGYGVKHLTPEQFARIFGGHGDVRRGVTPREIVEGFALPFIDDEFETPMSRMLMRLPRDHWDAYFGNEWCLFVSNGCAYGCSFCAADKRQRERFRPTATIVQEVNTICAMLYQLGKTSTDIYLSSLDILQNPVEMETVLRATARRFAEYGIQPRFRGLATAKCLVKATRHDRAILRRWHDEFGVICIGIGVDGSAPDEWRAQKKQHNTQDEIDEALGAIRAADMTPEALMVIGFPESSVRTSLRSSLACLKIAARPEGIVVRPYLGKTGVPGSDAWNEGRIDVDRFLDRPELFRNFEYPMLGTPETHPDCRQRWAANAGFLAAVGALKLTRRGCPTQPLLPTQSDSLPLRLTGRLWNRLMPGDR